MCIPALGAALGLGGAGTAGATVAGATGAATTATTAATAASTLTGIGTALGIGGSLLSGVVGYQSAGAQADALEAQAKQEAALGAQQDQRQRKEFMSAIAKQRAELAAAGVQLDSVTAVALGDTAAREMSFDSQAIRSGTGARVAGLTSQAKAARSSRFSSLLRGTLSAADTFLTAAPELWPGLKGA